MKTTTPTFLYDTFDVSFSSPADAVAADKESYTVFRNRITSSAEPIADVPVADYFSLDTSPPETPRRGDETPRRGDETPSVIPAATGASDLTWVRHGSRFKSPMLQLHKEILDFSDFVSPTPEEQASRSAAVQCVVDVVKYIWPHCKVEIFGSFRTGLYLPTSDIDVVILEAKVKTPQTGLYALSRALSQRSIVKNMQVIAKARVPIVKFVEKQSGIAFDISFDMESGPKAADFIKDALTKIPPLRPLCMVLKVFLQQRELNEVFSGGIGSYALLSMLIAHLQMYRSRQNLQPRQQQVEHNLGILLVNFFDLYGRKLNTTDVGVSCNSVGTFFLKSHKGFLNTERPYLLSIEDPQTPENDIGKNSFNYFKVRSAFAMAYSQLTDPKVIVGSGQHRGILGNIIRPDPVLLERRGGCNGELTFDRLLPGAGEPVAENIGNGIGKEHDMICNWQLVDDDEPLPREKIVAEDETLLSSQGRRSSKTKRRIKKDSHEENGFSKQSSVKKKKSKGFQDEDGFSNGRLPRYGSRSR